MADEKFTEAEVKALIAEAIKQHADSAFPEGDTHGHKRAHDMLIKDFRARQQMKEATLTKIVTGVAWAVVVGLAYAVWSAVKNEVQR